MNPNLNSNQNDGNPSNFNDLPMGTELLLAMYNTPSKELSTDQIAKIISQKMSTEDNVVLVDKGMVSTIYKTLGDSLGQELDLRKRLRVAPKPQSTKPARVTKAQVLDNIFGQLGLLEEEFIESDSVLTPQEEDYVDEMVESHQFDMVDERISNYNGTH